MSRGNWGCSKKSPFYFVLPSYSEASLASLGTASLLTSFGTASPGRPLGLRLGATKKGARDASIPLCLPEARQCRGTPRFARGDKKVGSGATTGGLHKFLKQP
jgi:hypothetical protein